MKKRKIEQIISPIPGNCTYCNTPANFILDKQVNTNRWSLKESVTCMHCHTVLTAVVIVPPKIYGRKKAFD